MYDGQYIVNITIIILVTINYRLGALGFLVWRRRTRYASRELGDQGEIFLLLASVRLLTFRIILFCEHNVVYTIPNWQMKLYHFFGFASIVRCSMAQFIKLMELDVL